MAPKVKYTKDEIVLGALQVARRCGIQNITAREVAAELKASTRPIFTYFNTMQELREAVYQITKERFSVYVQKGLQENIPFLGYGMQMIHFAQKEPELYKSLFVTKFCDDGETLLKSLFQTFEPVLQSVMQIYRMTRAEAEHYYRSMTLVGYGVANLIIAGCFSYEDTEIEQIFTEYSLAICKAIKEIPGFISGNYHKNELFRHIIGNSGTEEGKTEL